MAGDQHEIELRIAIKEIVAALPANERTAVILKSQGYTQQEIADYMGVSQQRVSQIFKEILVKHAPQLQ